MSRNALYSQRNNDEPFTFESNWKFWKSFRAYFKKILAQEWLFEAFNDYNEYENKQATAVYLLEQEMMIQLGFEIHLSVDESKLPSTNNQLDFIEFLYRYISLPTGYSLDVAGQSYPVQFDKAKARYEYAIQVNDMFTRNNMAFKIVKGNIEKVHSIFLDKSLELKNLSIDKQLYSEARQAVRLFKSRNSADMKTGLTTIANAFERAKTLKYPDNKRESIRQIIKKATSDNKKLEDMMNSHFTMLTDISNNCDIRHKEKDKIEVESESLQEYLFYSYYNAIRFIVSQLNDELS